MQSLSRKNHDKNGLKVSLKKNQHSYRISKSGSGFKNPSIFGQIYRNLAGVFSPNSTYKLYMKFT